LSWGGAQAAKNLYTGACYLFWSPWYFKQWAKKSMSSLCYGKFEQYDVDAGEASPLLPRDAVKINDQ
jgi:hypothetical protein